MTDTKTIITKDITTVQGLDLKEGKILGVKDGELGQGNYIEPIPLSEKGVAGGVATLDENGKVVQSGEYISEIYTQNSINVVFQGNGTVSDPLEALVVPNGVVEPGDKNVISGGEVFDMFYGINAFSKEEKVIDRERFLYNNNQYLSSSNSLVIAQGYGVTDYINIDPSTLYLWFGNLRYNRVCIEYDENKKPIRVIVNKQQSTTTIINQEFTTSANAKYIRGCSLLTNGGVDIDCGFIKKSGFNKILQASDYLKRFSGNVTTDTSVYNYVALNNRTRFTPPFTSTIWSPSAKLPANNYDNTNYSDFMVVYDTIISSFNRPQFSLTKKSLGKDQSGTFDVFEIVLELTPQSRLKEQPIIILNSCIHGSEFANAFALRDFFDLLLNSNEEPYNYLRNNFKWVIIPISNPYGFENRIRSNSRGVNLNRNFPDGWKAQGVASDFGDYSGISPLSENESKIIDSVLKKYNYLFFLDLHSYSGFSDNPYLMFFADFYNKGLIDSMFSMALDITEKTKELIPESSSNNRVFAYMEEFDYFNSSGNGTLQRYGYGINPNSVSVTLELAMRVYNQATGTSQVRTINLSVLTSFVINVIRNYSF